MQPTEPDRRRWSKLAVTSFVLGLLGLVLSVFAAIPAFLFGVLALIQIKRSRDRLRGRGLAIAGVGFSILFMAVFVCLLKLALLWRLDAPPIENDYTMADLRSAPAEFDRSYELLLSLEEGEPDAADGLPAIGLTSEDIDLLTRFGREFRNTGYGYDDIRRVVLSDPNGILRAWKNARKGRDIIEQLSGFDEIADLKPPVFPAELDYGPSLIKLGQVCHFYVCMATEQGESEQAIRELIELDKVFRKLVVNARSNMLNLICHGGIMRNYRTANFIVNNPHASRESLDMLSAHFTLLSKEQRSWRNSCVFEYLARRNMLDSTFEVAISCNYVLLKRNSTVRVLRNHFDACINYKQWKEGEYDPYQFSVWPDLYPDFMPRFWFGGDLDPFETWQYRWYNPVGSIFLAMSVPSFKELLYPQARLVIQEELFRILLDKRLGKEVSLKARAYSDEYAIDVDKKIIYSPGPDGEAFTQDDIKLPINPEVIKFN